MKPKILILLAVLALAAFGAWKLRPHSEAKAEEPEAKEAPPAPGKLHLDPKARAEAGIETVPAGPGRLRIELSLPGEITLNEDRVAHVVPRVEGLVREVRKSLGDRVTAGEVLAVLESRELAESKSAYVTASRRLEIARAGQKREETLFKEGASSGKEVFESQGVLAEAENAFLTAQQRLMALGLSAAAVAGLGQAGGTAFAELELKAPFAGAVIGKHLTLGEVVKSDAPAFLLADLSTVWANVTVYPQDLPRIHPGQKVRISCEVLPQGIEGEVAYLVPLVNEKTRAAIARVILTNVQGHCRPGMFITGRILLEEAEAPLTVPVGAVMDAEGGKVVFVETSDGDFELRRVKPGRSDGTLMEILGGMAAGEKVVSRNAFVIKAEMGKGAGGED